MEATILWVSTRYTRLLTTLRGPWGQIWAVHMLMSPFKLTNGHIQLFVIMKQGVTTSILLI